MVIGMVSVKYLSTSVTILQQVLVLCAASLLYKCSTSCMNSFFQMKHKICLSLSMFGTKLKKKKQLHLIKSVVFIDTNIMCV